MIRLWCVQEVTLWQTCKRAFGNTLNSKWGPKLPQTQSRKEATCKQTIYHTLACSMQLYRHVEIDQSHQVQWQAA